MNEYLVMRPIRLGLTSYQPGDMVVLYPQDAAHLLALKLISLKPEAP